MSSRGFPPLLFCILSHNIRLNERERIYYDFEPKTLKSLKFLFHFFPEFSHSVPYWTIRPATDVSPFVLGY